MNITELIEQERISKKSGIMQYPDEMDKFINFMIDNEVKSYLEIGVKRGHLTAFIKKHLNLNSIYACDLNRPELFDDYPEINFFQGDSNSAKYAQWRKDIGHIDMVLIDADHKYKPAKKDYLREKAFPHTFLALHDIANIGYPHLSKLWRKEVVGKKIEFINENKNSRLLCIEHKDDEYMKKYKVKYGHSCGIGVVTSK